MQEFPPQAAERPLRVLLVDDEPLARARLRFLLKELAIGPLANQVVGEAGDAQMAWQRLDESPVDVILLDVHMPGLDGVEFVRQLRRRAVSPEVIFVTAYSNHAIEAFEVDAADYLSKPVSLVRLEAALARIVRRRSTSPVGVSAAAPSALSAPSRLSARTALTVTYRGSVKLITLQEVLYLKSEWKYTTLRTETEQHLLDDSLLDLEQRLGPAFLRVHRNALVAISAIDALERRDVEGLETWSVRVRPVNEWIDVSRRQVAAVRKVLAGGAT